MPYSPSRMTASYEKPDERGANVAHRVSGSIGSARHSLGGGPSTVWAVTVGALAAGRYLQSAGGRDY